MKTLIKVSSLSKQYDDQKILEDISFDLRGGDFTTLIGHNGAGKSTTLRLLAGVEKTSAGQVRAFEKDPFAFDFTEKSKIFFIHEELAIHYPDSMGSFLTAYRHIYPKWDMALFKQIIKERKINLKKKFTEYSRGQKIQFLMAVALCSGAEVLLLDEVTAVLDVDAQLYFLEKLKKFADNGGAVMISTNILNEVNSFTNRVLMIQNKKLMIDASIESLKTEYVLLKKTVEHSFFQSDRVSRVSSRTGVQNLYIAFAVEVPSDLRGQVVEAEVTLADVVQLHFKLQEGEEYEDLVA